MSTFCGDGVNFQNEIVLGDVDMPTAVSDAKLFIEQENSHGLESRNVPFSDVFAPEGEFSGCPVIDENRLSVVSEDVGVEIEEECFSSGKVSTKEKLICEERHDVQKSNVTVAEILDVNAKVGEDMGSESLTRPFHFLVRMPRFDDSKRKQYEQAKLLVEEKTQIRDAARLEIHKYKANCREHAAGYDAAVSEARAAKRAVKSKRAEIDALQSLMSKVKNALSVEEIDARIVNLEHLIEHETLPLKEEKQIILEIKQLKQLRDQLSSNIGGQDKVQQALNKRGQIEERLKDLKKELDGLKRNVLKAEAIARTMEKTYKGENKKLKEVQDRFKDADSDRQDAYKHMQSLKREMDKKVESTMELWNKNVEFREEYSRCNMSSTHRRLGTCDGRSLGPFERVDQLVDRPVNNPFFKLLQKSRVKPIEVALADDGCFLKEAAVKSSETKASDQEKHHSGNVSGVVLGNDITNDITGKEHLPNKEESEVAIRDQEHSREDSVANWKEQRRLEEKSKALEALERKKRNLEKAQLRAELRAQKEAEQREKEREKRLRKKDRKKFIGAEAPDANNLGDVIHRSELVTVTLTEPDTKETAAVLAKKTRKPSFLTKQSKAKSISPPLRNRGRKKLQQWIWVIVTCFVVVLLFLVGNIGFFSSLSNNLRRPT